MKQLAQKIGVQPRSVSGFEKGEYEPSQETLKRIGEVLRFPRDFFFGDDIETPSEEAVSFRALSKMTAGTRDSALGAGAMALMLNNWLEQRFKLPLPDLPDLNNEDPEGAAEQVRSEWGLAYRPIKNVIHLLESRGVRVFSLAEDTRAVDAYSLWNDHTPVVLLNTMKSAERSRFDAAHELGHLVLHKHGAPQGQEAEMQANAFAAAFLMPAASVFQSVRGVPTIPRLIQLKKKWNVSVAALAHRLWKLQFLSDWQYRALCIEMGDMRKKEPEPTSRERSLLWEKVFGSSASKGISKGQVARELSVGRGQIEELTFGLSVVRGGARPERRRKPDLKLV